MLTLQSTLIARLRSCLNDSLPYHGESLRTSASLIINFFVRYVSFHIKLWDINTRHYQILHPWLGPCYRVVLSTPHYFSGPSTVTQQIQSSLSLVLVIIFPY